MQIVTGSLGDCGCCEDCGTCECLADYLACSPRWQINLTNCAWSDGSGPPPVWTPVGDMGPFYLYRRDGVLLGGCEIVTYPNYPTLDTTRVELYNFPVYFATGLRPFIPFFLTCLGDTWSFNFDNAGDTTFYTVTCPPFLLHYEMTPFGVNLTTHGDPDYPIIVRFDFEISCAP